MKVRVTVYGKVPKSQVFAIHEVAGGRLVDEIQELLTEVHYLVEYELLKGKILGFCVSVATLEDLKSANKRE